MSILRHNLTSILRSFKIWNPHAPLGNNVMEYIHNLGYYYYFRGSCRKTAKVLPKVLPHMAGRQDSIIKKLKDDHNNSNFMMIATPSIFRQDHYHYLSLTRMQYYPNFSDNFFNVSSVDKLNSQYNREQYRLSYEGYNKLMDNINPTPISYKLSDIFSKNNLSHLQINTSSQESLRSSVVFCFHDTQYSKTPDCLFKIYCIFDQEIVESDNGYDEDSIIAITYNGIIANELMFGTDVYTTGIYVNTGDFVEKQYLDDSIKGIKMHVPIKVREYINTMRNQIKYEYKIFTSVTNPAKDITFMNDIDYA